VDLDRKHMRMPVQSRVFIELEAAAVGGNSDSSIAICETLDVSARGLQVSLGHELPEQAYLQIGIEPFINGEISEPFFLAAQVRWCRADDSADQRWLAGLALLEAQHSDIDRWVDLISGME
jgi:PilZ domain